MECVQMRSILNMDFPTGPRSTFFDIAMLGFPWVKR